MDGGNSRNKWSHWTCPECHCVFSAIRNVQLRTFAIVTGDTWHMTYANSYWIDSGLCRHWMWNLIRWPIFTEKARERPFYLMIAIQNVKMPKKQFTLIYYYDVYLQIIWICFGRAVPNRVPRRPTKFLQMCSSSESLFHSWTSLWYPPGIVLNLTPFGSIVPHMPWIWCNANWSFFYLFKRQQSAQTDYGQYTEILYYMP